MADHLISGLKQLQLIFGGYSLTTSTSISNPDPPRDGSDVDGAPMVTGGPQEKAPLFELVIAHGNKGFGLFATSNIPRGTRIIEEAPLMAVPKDDSDLGVKLSDLTEALSTLTPEQRETFFDLYRDRSVHTSSVIGKILAQGGTSIKAPRVQDTLDMIAIFQTNAVSMGENHEFGSGVFANYSRINHACNPNVHNSYNPTIVKLTVHAVRQINKGEEIVTTYVNGNRTCEQRNAELRHWGFQCECKCCSGPKVAASERRRVKIFEGDQKLAAYEDGRKFHLRLPIPRTPEAALQVAEEQLELLRAESLVCYALAGVYRECSKSSLESGHFDKAVNYAKKERDVESYCIGTETAHLEKDMRGAEFWLELVMSERTKDQAKQKANEKLLKEEMAREAAAKDKKSGKGKAKGKGKKK